MAFHYLEYCQFPKGITDIQDQDPFQNVKTNAFSITNSFLQHYQSVKVWSIKIIPFKTFVASSTSIEKNCLLNYGALKCHSSKYAVTMCYQSNLISHWRMTPAITKHNGLPLIFNHKKLWPVFPITGRDFEYIFRN